MTSSPAAPPTGASPWLVSYADIAELAGVKRPVPTTWARRHGDFPKPCKQTSGREWFDGHKIVDWLLRTERGKTDPRHLRAELGLHTLTSWSQRIPARQLVDMVTALICLWKPNNEPLIDTTATDAVNWAAIRDRARDADSEDNYLLRESLDAQRWGIELAQLVDELVEATYSPAEAFESVMESSRRLGCHDLSVNTVTPELTQCLVEFLGIEDQGVTLVANPDAGRGDLLIACHIASGDESMASFLAADIDPSLARLVRRRMRVRDLAHDDIDVQTGEDVTEYFGAPDAMVSVLPFQAAETRRPETVLWRIEAITDQLAEGSIAVVLGPADALAGPLPEYGDADRLRRSFLSNGLLKAVIDLPGGAMPYRPGYRTAAWVLSRTPKSQQRGEALLVDLSGHELAPSTLSDLADDMQIWRTAGWRIDGHDPRRGAMALVKELDARAGAALRPWRRPLTDRFTRQVLDRPVRIGEQEVRLAESATRAHSEIEGRAELRAGAILRADDEGPPRTTIGALLKQRRLRKVPGLRIAAEHIVDSGDHTVLTPADVCGLAVPGTRRIDRAVLVTHYTHAQLTEPGDVVVTTSPEFGVFLDREGFSIVAAPARILRVRSHPERPVRAGVLAALLGEAATSHRRTHGTVRSARRLEELEIPDLDPAEADRLDALMAEIDHRQALLQEQADALDEIRRLTAAGIADGSLTMHGETQ